MSGNEIITIQFGAHSNSVGAHFFNIQNAGFSFNPDFPTDINHDILFREGQSTSGGFTYTPRLVLVDVDESLHCLSQSGERFTKPPPVEEVQTISGFDKLEIRQINQPPDKNEYFEDLDKQSESSQKQDAMDVDLVLKTKYDLTKSIKSWSEILMMNLHQRSLSIIPKPLSTGLVLPMSTCVAGTDIWNSPSFADPFEDNIRFQLESCDNVQGFHLLTECDNLYSGLSKKCLDYLKDECEKKSIITFPIFNIYTSNDELENRKRICSNVVNTAYLFSGCNEFSDLIAPFSLTSNLWADELESTQFGNLSYDISSEYHRSAIIASCLEMTSTPYRLRRLPETKISNITALLNLPSRKFIGAGIVCPFPDQKIDYDILELLRRHKYSSLCPYVPLEETLDSQIVTLRGFPHAQFPTSPALFVSRFNVRVPRTFPDIVSPQHDLGNTALYYGKLREVSGLSGMCNSREMKNLFDKMGDKLRSFNMRKIPSFLGNLEKQEYDEIFEEVQNISASYDISMFL